MSTTRAGGSGWNRSNRSQVRRRMRLPTPVAESRVISLPDPYCAVTRGSVSTGRSLPTGTYAGAVAADDEHDLFAPPPPLPPLAPLPPMADLPGLGPLAPVTGPPEEPEPETEPEPEPGSEPDSAAVPPPPRAS